MIENPVMVTAAITSVVIRWLLESVKNFFVSSIMSSIRSPIDEMNLFYIPCKILYIFCSGGKDSLSFHVVNFEFNVRIMAQHMFWYSNRVVHEMCSKVFFEIFVICTYALIFNSSSW